MIKRIIVLPLMLLLANCATDYQPMNYFSGGYKEMRLSNDVYLVEYQSNEFTSNSTNTGHALRRAAELSKQHDCKYFEVLSNTDNTKAYTTPISMDTYSDSSQLTNGFANNYGGLSSVHTYGTGYGNTHTTISGGNTYVQPGIILKVRLLKNKTKNAYDADMVLSNF